MKWGRKELLISLYPRDNHNEHGVYICSRYFPFLSPSHTLFPSFFLHYPSLKIFHKELYMCSHIHIYHMYTWVCICKWVSYIYPYTHAWPWPQPYKVRHTGWWTGQGPWVATPGRHCLLQVLGDWTGLWGCPAQQHGHHHGSPGKDGASTSCPLHFNACPSATTRLGLSSYLFHLPSGVTALCDFWDVLCSPAFGLHG